MFKECVTAVIGIGSNLDSPKDQVIRAIDSLNRLDGCQLLASSSLYASKPQGPQDQPDFVNAVAVIETTLSPQALLARLQALEIRQGKNKLRHWGERVIDLDILLYGQQVIHTDDLQVPHPQMAHRDFVLLPLQEILPDCEIPGVGAVGDLVNQLTETFVIPL